MKLPTRRLATLSGLLISIQTLCVPKCIAHLDPPGPPPLLVNANLVDCKLLNDQDDGFDGNAELFLVANVTHLGHGQNSKNVENDAVDWDVSPLWTINLPVWSHEECSPRNPVVAGTSLIELDTNMTEGLALALASAAAGAVAGTVVPGVGNVVGAIGGGVVGLGISLFGVFNGNDDLGVASGIIPANGNVKLTSNGDDGSAEIQFSGTTSVLPDMGQCSVPQPPDPPSTPDDRHNMIYPPIRKALGPVKGIAPEPGNPGQLAAADLDWLRASMLRLLLGMADLVAGAEIDDARSFDGVQTAFGFLSAARSAAALRDTLTAIAYYDSAFYHAAVARYAGIPHSPQVIPLQIDVICDSVGTLPHRKLHFLTAVLGTTDSSSISVAGGPAGMSASVSRLVAGVPVFDILLDLASVMPGNYSVGLNASSGGQFASRSLSLRVAVPPPVGVPTGPVLSSRIEMRVQNPVSGEAQVWMRLVEGEVVELKLFDARGRLVRDARPGFLSAGTHAVRFDVSGLPAGFYVMQGRLGTHETQAKLIIRQ